MDLDSEPKLSVSFKVSPMTFMMFSMAVQLYTLDKINNKSNTPVFLILILILLPFLIYVFYISPIFLFVFIEN